MLRPSAAPEQPSSPVGPAQRPAVHASPCAQAWSQLPQCATLACVSTHSPSQSVWPSGHAHLAALHTMPPSHAMSQPPQCSSLVCVSKHAPAQNCCAFWHTHVPAWHTRPPPQVPVQVVLSGPRHCPLSHVCPAAHAIPHVLQFIGSLKTSAHMPLQNCQPLGHEHASGSLQTPLHSIWPTGQPHAPPTHAVPAGQAWPHTPQWA